MATLATLRGGDKKERELYKIYNMRVVSSPLVPLDLFVVGLTASDKKKQKQKTD